MRRIAVPTATRLPTKLPRPHINVPPITTRPSRHALRPERRDARTLKRPLYYGCLINRQPAALDGFNRRTGVSASRPTAWFSKAAAAADRPALPEESSSVGRECCSQYLEHAVDRTLGPPVPAAHGEDAVHPVVLLRGGFEHRVDAEVVRGRIAHLSLLDAGDDIRGTVTNALVGHSDVGTIVGLQYQPDVEPGRAVLANRLPIVASIQHVTVKPLAFECAARDDAEPTEGGRRRAGHDERPDIEPHDEQRACAHALEKLGQTVRKTGRHGLFLPDLSTSACAGMHGRSISASGWRSLIKRHRA